MGGGQSTLSHGVGRKGPGDDLRIKIPAWVCGRVAHDMYIKGPTEIPELKFIDDINVNSLQSGYRGTQTDLRLYQHSSGQYIIGIKGTDDVVHDLLVVDWGIYLDRDKEWGEQFRCIWWFNFLIAALLLIKRHNLQDQVSNIVFCGHSLGGGLAKWLGHHIGCLSVGYNAPHIWVDVANHTTYRPYADPVITGGDLLQGIVSILNNAFPIIKVGFDIYIILRGIYFSIFGGGTVSNAEAVVLLKQLDSKYGDPVLTPGDNAFKKMWEDLGSAFVMGCVRLAYNFAKDLFYKLIRQMPEVAAATNPLAMAIMAVIGTLWNEVKHFFGHDEASVNTFMRESGRDAGTFGTHDIAYSCTIVTQFATGTTPELIPIPAEPWEGYYLQKKAQADYDKQKQELIDKYGAAAVEQMRKDTEYETNQAQIDSLKSRIAGLSKDEKRAAESFIKRKEESNKRLKPNGPEDTPQPGPVPVPLDPDNPTPPPRPGPVLPPAPGPEPSPYPEPAPGPFPPLVPTQYEFVINYLRKNVEIPGVMATNMLAMETIRA